MNKILIITLSNIGDVLLTLPSIQVVREAFPFAQISLVVGERSAALFDGDPRFKKVWVWRKQASLSEKISTVLEIGKEGFSRVVNFRNPVRRNHGMPHRRLLHFQKLVQRKMVSPTKLNQVNTQQVLWIPESVQTKTKELLKAEGISLEKKWILITPGSLNMTKRWKIEGFIELCRQLTQQQRDPILLTGDQTDRSRSQEIIKNVPSPLVFDLCGKTELLQLAWLIREAKLLVSHDSAPLHMASLLGTPVIAIFGPTDPVKYGPWRANSRVIRKSLFCSPCEKSLCAYHHECMEQIYPQYLLKAVNELFQS